jgi:2-keto-4-pentenoate hydratase/2-oxohepta-3-ene-1,7-dioic acid hydratase in catechol pathway
MLELIRNWDSVRRDVQQIALSAGDRISLDELHLEAPISRPGKVLAIGLNYLDHINESKLTPPEHQVWFSKQPTAVNGPFDPIEVPKVASSVDYEAELVVVIGRAGRHIPNASAALHVFGYCCGNDVSVRDWQRQTPQWMLGKSFDTHAPFGPWIVTSDEVGDPHSLEISCYVNGDRRQHSNTRHLLFNIFDQIEHVSKVMTLEPGDIIYSGTPGGVGAAMNPPRFLAAGDRVKVEIEQLGSIEAVFTSED